MEKHYIQIGGKQFILAFKDNNLSLFEYTNGQMKLLNPNNINQGNAVVQVVLSELVKEVGKGINKKLKDGEYANLSEATNDIQKKIGSINMPQLNSKVKDLHLETNEDYKLLLNNLETTFTKLELEQKKQMVENSIDVDLRTLFAENGITEYEVSQSKSVVTYMKDGMPHTLNNTDPSKTIYEVVLQSLQFDKMNSREEIDNEIARIMKIESEYKYENNTTLRESEFKSDDFESYTEEIAKYLKDNYNINEVYGIKPASNSYLDGGLLVNIGNGWQPVFVTKGDDGVLSVTFGKEKQIDNNHNVEANDATIGTNESLKEDLDYMTKTNQLKNIYLKLLQEEELTEEETQVLDSYKNDESLFNNLKQEDREICMQALELYENILREKYPERFITTNEGPVKKLGEMPTYKDDQRGVVYIGIITFICGFISGINLFIFLKLFS